MAAAEGGSRLVRGRAGLRGVASRWTGTRTFVVSAAAIFLLAINVIGLVLLPALVGALSDALAVRHGSDGLRYALLVLAGFNLWAVAHTLLSWRTLEADLAAAAD